MEGRLLFMGKYKQLPISKEFKEEPTIKTVYKNIVKERINKYGVNTLNDEEIISILTGVEIEKVKGYLESYGIVDFIKNIGAINITDIQKKKLELVYMISKRISTYKPTKATIDSSTQAGEYFVNDLKLYEKEVFKVLMLDNSKRIIKLEQVSEGTVNEAPIHIREITSVDYPQISIKIML